jgi:hypothetical protein
LTKLYYPINDDENQGEKYMQVRQEIFDTYWRFAAMRQEVFFNKLKNVPQ